MTEYADFLKKNVFKVVEYDQFNLLFDAMGAFSAANCAHAAIIERSYIYSDKSIFAGLFPPATHTHVIDYRPESADERAGYQSSWLDASGFDYPLAKDKIVDHRSHFSFSFDTLDCDTLAIPNVLHHCRDFPTLFAHLLKRMPNLKRVFVFDSYLRENHQNPDDFCRYTPSALSDVMAQKGFATTQLEETGNIFDAILYFISQAHVTLQRPEMSELRALLEDIAVPRLREVRNDRSLQPLGRKYASASTGYAMTFERA